MEKVCYENYSVLCISLTAAMIRAGLSSAIGGITACLIGPSASQRR